MSEKEDIVYFNATGMNPQELAISVKNLIKQGYQFLFIHRGWQYYALNGKAKV
jgi:hypothetical protein